MIGIENLSKVFGETHALDNVSLQAAKGEMLVLVGPSGCGKTTCLRCIAGLERPTSGRIRVGERMITAIEEGVFLPPEKREIGMVFQSYAVWPHMTVFENVAYPLRCQGARGDALKARVMEALKLVQLEALAERYSSQISGGQQQRVALARSLVSAPKLLLFDEPLSNLDANLRLQMRIEIKELQRKLGFTAVYVTHDQTEAMAIADRIAIMEKGVLRQVGTPRDIYERPANAFVASFMGTTNLLEGMLAAKDTAGAVVTTASGLEVRVAVAVGAAAGDAVRVSIRPEALQICAAPGGVNAWPATLRLATYLGESILYRADMLGHGVELHARPSETYPAGSAVTLNADPADCILLRE
ncbi:MAG: ABC transporter ATP-binding protein [Alphaproteobacteria bacterium]|nr:ABC transporter ATP-binding protein [Alphaproteobacteria bacterium]